MRTGAHWPYAELCFRGGCLPQCMLGYPPRSRHPLEQTPPGSRHPPEQTPQSRRLLGADTHTPLQSRPPRADPPGADTPPDQTPPQSRTPPVNRMPDTSKNITLATTSLRPVKIAHCEQQCVKYKDDATANAVCERTWKKFFLLKTIILKEPGKCFSY